MSRRIMRSNVVDRSGNRYCGPLVIAALCGCSTAEASVKVRSITGAKFVKGMYNRDLLAVLSSEGFAPQPVPVPMHYVRKVRPGFRLSNHKAYDSDGAHEYTPITRTGPTLAQWLRTRPDKTGTYVVNVTGHYVLISGRKFVDTRSRGEWVSIGKAPGRRSRVQKVFHLAGART